eukprot:sb/3474709/
MKFVEQVDNRFITAVTNVSSHVIRRVFWALIGVVCLVVTVWMSFLLLSDYFNYPSYTLIQTSYTDHYYLPAITICNVNFLNRTSMEADVLQGNINTYDVFCLAPPTPSEYLIIKWGMAPPYRTVSVLLFTSFTV